MFHRRFKEQFGVTPEVCAKLWTLLDPYATMANAVKPCHLLWALVFLKQYNTESNASSAVGGPDEKTYRKWVWHFVEAISYLESRVVSFAHLLFSCGNSIPNTELSLASSFSSTVRIDRMG